jgi:hypothetical protein
MKSEQTAATVMARIAANSKKKAPTRRSTKAQLTTDLQWQDRAVIGASGWAEEVS